MLILTRKEGEGIRLGDHIRIVLVQLKGNQVRLGIECPSTMRVLREELWQATHVGTCFMAAAWMIMSTP